MNNLNEFTNKMWYTTKIMLFNYTDKLPENPTIENLKAASMFHGDLSKLRSSEYKHLYDKWVKSYGVVDDYMIIEVMI